MAFDTALIDAGQHNDLTRADCKRLEITGLRYDTLMKHYEIWVLGNLVREVSAQQILDNPMAHILAYCEVFALDPETLNFVQH